jgi:Na+-driven multidrug efflux pump
VAAVSSIQTNVTIALATALTGLAAGPAAVAGFGTAARLEYLLVPLVFGIGAPLVAMVGTNIGAGQRERALRIAWIGALIAAVLCEIIGVAAAIWPTAWLRLFDSDPAMLETGSAYLRAVGPFYGCFGFGLALYFASQGAGKLLWPLLVGLLRMVVAIGGGWLALKLTGSLGAMFIAIGVALLVYGAGIAIAIKLGAWFPISARSPCS